MNEYYSMINNHDGKIATFRPNNREISGFKIDQLKYFDILFDMRRYKKHFTP